MPNLSSHVPPATVSSYPVRSGNVVRPLVDGIPAFLRIAEAILEARHGVWLTVAFFAPDFAFPDGSGSLFDVLDRAVARGLDVRILFWRPNAESSGYGRTFPGSQPDRDTLEARGSRFHARWDRADGPYCQHQKSWLIDAGHPSETAFIGGINLTAANLAHPGHRAVRGRHDLYVEVSGPSATDVHHNFVQRWTEASERDLPDGTWGGEGAMSMMFPDRVSEARGKSTVQIQRMLGRARYRDGHATPGGSRHDVSAGERSVLEQYEKAIEAARSSIYIENQALPVPEISRKLEDALKRGVEVVMLVPSEPEDYVRRARLDPAQTDHFAAIEALGRYGTFALVGIAVPDGQGRRHAVYVHAKTMLVDDAWATIGSCNLHRWSLSGHSEMNAAIWDPDIVRALRCQLLAEHLCQDTSGLDDRDALRLYRRLANHNRLDGNDQGIPWQGIAYAMNVADYGR